MHTAILGLGKMGWGVGRNAGLDLRTAEAAERMLAQANQGRHGEQDFAAVVEAVRDSVAEAVR